MHTSQWKESSILCLEDKQTHLYAELIQLLPQKTLAWLRPFAIQLDADNVSEDILGYGDRHPELDAVIFDLRETADLIWPIHLFRSGLDTEVINIIAALPSLPDTQGTQPKENNIRRRVLNQFLQRIWEANKQHFPRKANQALAEPPVHDQVQEKRQLPELGYDLI